MRIQIGLFVLIATSVYADVFTTLTKEAQDVIHAATENTTIRQCTCDEQEKCTNEITKQGLECVDECWDKFNAITDKPDQLHDCFHKADKTLGTFISCFERSVDSCVADAKEENQIQKVNISKLFELGAEKISKTKEKLTKTLAAPIRRIIDTVGDFGVCVKDCFLKKNANGFCFDKTNCQPLIVDKKAKSSLKTCSKIIDFKKEAGEICECSAKAGITELQQYCPLLKMIGSRRRGGSGNKTVVE